MSQDSLLRRLEREKRAREYAESLHEKKSSELYKMNKMLRSTANQLAAQKSQLNILLDHTSAGIFLANSNFTIIHANLYAERVFGFEPNTLFGCCLRELFCCDREKISELKTRNQLTDCHQDGEKIMVRRRDGTIFPIEFSVAATEMRGEEHSIWIFRDITERCKEEAERERLELELRQAQKLESLGTLASGIAHEINTPIQFVGDNLEFLRESFEDVVKYLDELKVGGGEAPERVGDGSTRGPTDSERIGLDFQFLKKEIPAAIDQSLEGIKRVRDIVIAVRDFSHPGSNEKIPTDLNAAVESTATISRNQWKYVATLDKDLDRSLPDVLCVPSEINQAILNLIVNAAQAIEELGNDEPGKITVRTMTGDRHVSIEVSDTGCGIPPELMDRIFDPFFTTKGVGKGTGQGLSLAHNVIAQKHGGKIFCESVPGKGSTFTIQLPHRASKTSDRAF